MLVSAPKLHPAPRSPHSSWRLQRDSGEQQHATDLWLSLLVDIDNVSLCGD